MSKQGERTDLEYADIMFGGQTLSGVMYKADVEVLQAHLDDPDQVKHRQRWHIRGYSTVNTGIDRVMQIDERWALTVWDRVQGIRRFPDTIVVSKEANPKDWAEASVGFVSP